MDSLPFALVEELLPEAAIGRFKKYSLQLSIGIPSTTYSVEIHYS
jgi:hypothetical protein